jgi:hypothetical protein
MHRRTIVQTRPSTNVEFWNRDNPVVTQEYLDYFRDTYVLTGALTGVVSTVSEDGLTMTTSLNWTSEAEAENWKNDPVVQQGFISKMESYQAANGIDAVRTKEDII